MELLIPIGIGAAILLAVIIFLLSIYRVADIDKALIITGGKEPVIKVSGGGFVIPIFRKASYFDLCMLTVSANNDEIKTQTSVPIIVDWTAQIRPDTNDSANLKKAIMSFKERGQKGIIEDVKLTLTGTLRDVVSNMTPEEVQIDKQKFAQSVRENVADEMRNMGLELVSLNIQDIHDNNGYYDNIAAIDMEQKRKEAEKVKAQTNQAIREQNAESEKIATQSELAAQLSVAEKRRDNSLKQSEYKAETDKAKADADIAGQLQTTIRQQEIAAQEGKVEVVRQEQLNLAAQKAADVVKTKAEAEKVKAEIDAKAVAEVATIKADADAAVAKKTAVGKADAIKIEAEAEADKIRRTGEADAEIVQKKGLAEAEAIKAKMMAEAEGEKALADARSANDKVNFEIEKLKIENQAKIEIATKTANIMADLGKNAEFVNIGGSSSPGATGNVLIDTLSALPQLLKKLDVENQALNGEPFNNTLNGLIASAAGPLKGMLVSNNPSNDESAADDETTSDNHIQVTEQESEQRRDDQ